MSRSRRRNGGLRKRCGCPRKVWPKCPHSWHFNYKPKEGPHYRISLDRELRKHIDSKSDAEIEAARIRVAIDEGTFRVAEQQQNEPSTEVLNAYAREWLRTSVGHLKASTVRFYSGHLEKHILPLLGDRPIGEVTRKDCRELIAVAREKDLTINSVRGILRTLSVILSQAVDDGRLPANPALSMRKYLRRGDEPEPVIDPLTKDEAAHLIAIAREHFPQWHAWVLTALRTGMRIGELLALQWGDVDWRGRYVLVRRNLVRGKVTTPKNHQQRRVDLTPHLRAVLRLWRRRQNASWLKNGLPRPDWVFPSATGTPLDDCNVRRAFRTILDKAGLHRRGPHQMRHTFASLLLQAGEPITYVSRQLGHRDSAITLRVYAHWLPDTTARKGVEHLDDVRDAIPPESVAQRLHKPAVRPLRRIA